MSVVRRGLGWAVLFVLAASTPLLAGNSYNWPQFTHEAGEFIARPAHWQGRDWLRLGLLTAGTVAVMQVDQPVRDAVLRDHGRYYRSVPVEAGRIWGEWYTPPVIAGAFGLHGWLADNRTSGKIGFEMVQAVVYAEAITQTLKIVLGRSRPYENKGAFDFHPFRLSGVGFHSLPGGHNTNGWAMSTIISRNTHSRALKILAYVPAVLTLASRVYQDKHWTSDDLSGAVIGIVVGSWVVNLHEKKDSAMSVSAVYPLTFTFTF